MDAGRVTTEVTRNLSVIEPTKIHFRWLSAEYSVVGLAYAKIVHEKIYPGSSYGKHKLVILRLSMCSVNAELEATSL